MSFSRAANGEQCFILNRKIFYTPSGSPRSYHAGVHSNVQAIQKRNVVNNFVFRTASMKRPTFRKICICPLVEAPDRFNCKWRLWLSLQRARGAEAVSWECICFPNMPIWPLLLVPLFSHQIQRQRQMAWYSVLHNACDAWWVHFCEEVNTRLLYVIFHFPNTLKPG